MLACDGSSSVSHVFDGAAGGSFPVAAATLSVWVNTTQTAAAVLLSYGAQTAGSAQRLTVENPSSLTLGAGTSSWDTGISVADGAWHQITLMMATVEPGFLQIQVLVDGVSQVQRRRAVAVPQGLPATGTLVLGAGIAAAGEAGFVGSLSEFRLWNYQLSAAESDTHLQRRVAATLAGIVLSWRLDNAATAGTPAGNPTYPKSTLTFRQAVAANPNFAYVDWQPVTGATDYDLKVTSVDGTWTFQKAHIAPANVPAPVPGLLLDRGYVAVARSNAGTTVGSWSTPDANANMTPLDLAVPNLVFSWPAVGQSIAATWPDVDQNQLYTIDIYQSPALPLPAQPTEQHTSTSPVWDLGSKAADPSAWAIVVSAGALNSVGPSSALAAFTAPVFTLYYVDPDGPGNGSFSLALPSSKAPPDFYYLRIQKGTTFLVDQAIPGSSASPVTVPSPATLVAGDQLIVTLRAIGGGVLSAWGTENITVSVLGRPAVQIHEATFPAAEALTASWASVATGATYDIQLFQDGGATLSISAPTTRGSRIP